MGSWDAIVVGGGPAGLACALWLGRARRSVCLFDTAEPRNEPAWGVHGYPGVLDPTPAELRGRIRRQARVAGASLVLDAVTEAGGKKNEFVIGTAAGERHSARRLVLAYGLRDELPDIPGLPSLYGSAVFHCVDCDGPEAAGRRVAVIGHERAAAALALSLLHWTDCVALLTNGHEPRLDADARATLEREGVAVFRERVARLEATDGALHAAELEGGTCVTAERLFFHLGSEPRSDLAARLGCEHDEKGFIRTDRGMETTTPGVYAAGDITGYPHLACTAAADGVRAALAIHRSLLLPGREL